MKATGRNPRGPRLLIGSDAIAAHLETPGNTVLCAGLPGIESLTGGGWCR